MDIVALAAKAEVTVYLWSGPHDLLAKAVREFLWSINPSKLQEVAHFTKTVSRFAASKGYRSPKIQRGALPTTDFDNRPNAQL